LHAQAIVAVIEMDMNILTDLHATVTLF